MQEIFHNSKGKIVRFGQRLGGGGEGVVYEVQGQEDLVAKVYYETPPDEKAEKLGVLTHLGAERLRGITAWPIDVLRDRRKGRVAGFVMNRFVQAEEIHTLHSPKSRLQKFPEASWEFLIHVAANLARAVAAIHEHGLVIGDVNPRNALVTRKGTVFLLDCDSFQVSIKGRVFRC
jgi:DNA-binding helix-hairpin-helix protein with protein kinase domain